MSIFLLRQGGTMKLSEISMKNFRCHRQIDNIPISKITTIVGENDSGKT